eukprot:TRINITY_DN3439_c0_g1_i2.p1 TRINITY_DN3439_c0_g1~~TRINITY_DN3439_c0_g1_i2.p1  ORF type:complete len:165 (-),score=17.10 TRINITY_DN3439_c0_g1_i2:30-524(-)
MDHHCPFINQCVGYRNHKLFVLFLFYSNLGILYCELIYGIRIWNLVHGQVPLSTIKESLAIIVNMLALAFVFFSTIILLGNQLFLVTKNTTKIELWTKHWATMDARDRGQKYRYPYDHGVVANLKEFFGESTLKWLVPTRRKDDGLHYPELVPDQPVFAVALEC